MAFFSLTDIKFKSESPRFFNRATNFEFNNKMTQLIFGGFFNQIASMLVDTFCERADNLHEAS